jgi:hypothetical protein
MAAAAEMVSWTREARVSVSVSVAVSVAVSVSVSVCARVRASVYADVCARMFWELALTPRCDDCGWQRAAPCAGRGDVTVSGAAEASRQAEVKRMEERLAQLEAKHQRREKVTFAS